MHTVVETPQFQRSAKVAKITERERQSIVSHFASNPKDGERIKGTGGARKMRFPGRGRGTSSGYRVVTFFSGNNIPVFLIDVFAKGDRIDLSQSERNKLKNVLKELADTYRGRQ